MRLAITGHRGISEATERLVDTAIRQVLMKQQDGELVGLSCIADGADAIFAQASLDMGGAMDYPRAITPSMTR